MGIVSKSTIEYATSSSDILNIWKHWNEKISVCTRRNSHPMESFSMENKKEDKKMHLILFMKMMNGVLLMFYIVLKLQNQI